MHTAIIREHHNLQPLNTLSVPATARWFTEVADETGLINALEFAARQHCPLWVLGSGSNVVLGEYFPGLVVKMAIAGIEVVRETDDTVHLAVGAGENWHRLVCECVRRGYHGIENLALIPGTVGAAPIQNIGAYGVELADVFSYLHGIDRISGSKHRFDCEDCEFGYRDSIFKHRLQDRMVITQVGLCLHKQPRWNLSYPALRHRLEAYSTAALDAQLIATTVVALRQSKLPDPSAIPNAGSFFTNPLVAENSYRRLHRQYPQMVSYPQANGHHKLAAGWLLDNAGWRGKSIAGVAMHHGQALVLVNPNRRPGIAVLAFAQSVQADIAAKYDIQLTIEPRLYV